jgi:hypothetical protein
MDTLSYPLTSIDIQMGRTPRWNLKPVDTYVAASSTSAAPGRPLLPGRCPPPTNRLPRLLLQSAQPAPAPPGWQVPPPPPDELTSSAAAAPSRPPRQWTCRSPPSDERTSLTSALPGRPLLPSCAPPTNGFPRLLLLLAGPCGPAGALFPTNGLPRLLLRPASPCGPACAPPRPPPPDEQTSSAAAAPCRPLLPGRCIATCSAVCTVQPVVGRETPRDMELKQVTEASSNALQEFYDGLSVLPKMTYSDVIIRSN